MSSNVFRIEEHVVPCQHIREYPGATANEQEDVLHLAVKQYIPLDNLNPQPGDVTIIGAHANGFPKELYEPLWEEIVLRSKKQGFRIRSIWMADVAHQGQSGVLNEDIMGNDPGWLDHPRDLMHLINLKRDQMPRPIVGIGHSMGGNNLVNVSLMHPRLLTSLVLLDPVIQKASHTTPTPSPGPAQLSTFRRDLWPSRAAAAASYKKSAFYQPWDSRVLDRWIKYGLRDLPTAIYPDTGLPSTSQSGSTEGPPVTLTTTKHQEVFTFLRPNFDGDPDNSKINRRTHADLDPSLPSYPFYRPEQPKALSQLPFLRPSVLYIFGGLSDMSTPELRAQKMERTGTGVGGSGGVKEGRVKEVVLHDYGHLIAMEAVSQCADASAEWIGTEMERWRSEEEEFRREWAKKTKIQKLTVDEEWKRMVGGAPTRPGKGRTKL